MAVLHDNASLTGAADAARFGRVTVALAATAGLLVLGTVVLWAHYGTAVFYEMVLAGLAACF